MRVKGFSLIESLISLSLFLIIALAGLEVFGVSRRIYASLQKKEEASRTAVCALDKIKSDLASAGEGLVQAMRLGAVQGVSIRDGGFVILSSEAELSLAQDAAAGQSLLILSSTNGLKAGREICLSAPGRAEVHAISAVQGLGIVLSGPLGHSYLKEETGLCLLRQVSCFLDGRTGLIRRKVNAGPAQPLLEDAAAFECTYDEPGNMARVKIRLRDDEEKTYEIAFFPKNTGLAVI